VLILLLAHASGRRYDPVTLLAWIALGLVVWRPCDLWSLGFQLSLGMTGALFWLAHSLNARIFNQPLRGTVRFREHRWKDRLSAICQEAITANVLCYSLSLPVLIYRIGWISPLAIVVSIVVTPLVIVTLWIGYIALLVGMAIPAAAGAASSLLGALATWTVGVVTWADGLSFSSLHVPPVSALWTACATLAIIAALRLGFRRRDKPARSAAVLGSLAVCGCWLVVEWTVLIRLSPSTAMRIDMLDVGDGSCLFVRSGNQAILWDCGTLSSTGVQTRVIDAARALNIYETPTVVVTHPDIDHFGGILDVAKTLGIRLVLIPRRFFDEAAVRPRGAAAYGLKELSRRGIVVREIAEGDSLQVGAVAVRFLSPPKGAEFEKDNNHSLVGLWCKPNGRPEGDVEQYVLTTGDIEDDAISSLANRYPHLQPIVLELPHHGSAHRRSIEWVDELSPRVVLQSTGPRRANDPRWAAAKEGKRWYTTAISGAAWVEIGMDGGIRSGSHKPEEPSKR